MDRRRTIGLATAVIAGTAALAVLALRPPTQENLANSIQTVFNPNLPATDQQINAALENVETLLTTHAEDPAAIHAVTTAVKNCADPKIPFDQALALVKKVVEVAPGPVVQGSLPMLAAEAIAVRLVNEQTLPDKAKTTDAQIEAALAVVEPLLKRERGSEHLAGILSNYVANLDDPNKVQAAIDRLKPLFPSKQSRALLAIHAWSNQWTGKPSPLRIKGQPLAKPGAQTAVIVWRQAPDNRQIAIIDQAAAQAGYDTLHTQVGKQHPTLPSLESTPPETADLPEDFFPAMLAFDRDTKLVMAVAGAESITRWALPALAKIGQDDKTAKQNPGSKS